MWLSVGNLNTQVTRYENGERAWLAEYLSFTDGAKWFRSGKQTDQTCMLNRLTDTFPSGLLPLARKAAEDNGYSVSVADARVAPTNPCGIDLSWLRDYQLSAVQKVVHKVRGILWCPTASGKTEMAIGIVQELPCTWLFIVHRAGLMHQTADRYENRTGDVAGRIGEGVWSVERFTVATFQTLHSAMRTKKQEAALALLQNAQGIIVDECFPAGTMIGNIPIEQIRKGDLVDSFDTSTQKACVRRVARTFSRKPTALVQVKFVSGRSIVCTPNHKFWCKQGWVPAENTCGLDVRVLYYAHAKITHQKPPMHALWYAYPTYHNQRKPTGLLYAMQKSSVERARQNGICGLRFVRQNHNAIRTARARTRKTTTHLLLRRMQKKSVEQKFQTNCYRTRGVVQRTHERTQSNVRPGMPRKGIKNVTPNTAQATVTRRQRTRHARTSTHTIGRAYEGTRRLDSRTYCHNEEGCRFTQPHQSRHREQQNKGGRGGRRPVSWCEKSSGGGQPKGHIPSWDRVESVTVLEQGSNGTFGGMCPGGLVYNLEVEGTHTYTANGVVVSNCHTLPAESFWRVAMRTPAAYYRVGLSGTPLARGDRRSLLAIAALGPVIYRIKPETLITRGVVAKPHVRLVEVRQTSEKATWQGVYGDVVIRSSIRNKALVNAAKRAAKPAFLFVKQINHGKKLEKALWRAGLRAAFVWGTHSTEWRDRAIRDLVKDRIDVLVTSVVMQEGVDVPELRSVIVGAGGKSVIAALQRLGRGMRKAEGKTEFEVWDIADRGCGCHGAKHRGCKWLERHTRGRIHAYTQEGYETVVEGI